MEITNSQLLEKLENRFDVVDQRLDKMDAKIDNVHEALDQKIDNLAAATKKGFDAMQLSLSGLTGDFKILKHHAALTDARIEKLETLV